MDEMHGSGTGRHRDLIRFVSDRPGHDARYAIDPARISQELGWTPSVTVEQGLRRTVQWYLDHPDWWTPLLGVEGVGSRVGTGTIAGTGT
jgi:dTDP-glucose 4,6-dehydratase